MRVFILCLWLIGICCNSDQRSERQTESKFDPALGYNKKVEINSKPTDSIDLNIVLGNFEPSTHPNFVLIDIKDADREGLYLQTEAYDAFKKMKAAAAEEDVHLVIKSATRNFDYQKGIWERKWNGTTILSDGVNAKEDIHDPVHRALKILEYSSMPGTSRHHWGTDIDLNAFNNRWFESGEGLALYNWMSKHASTYGFCQPYSPKGEQRPHGYNEEKWHWSYLPIANEYTSVAMTHLNDNLISGFNGAETAGEIGVVEKYIFGINSNCK